MPNSCRGASLSPPIRTKGQKQLNPWPRTDLAATVDETVYKAFKELPRISPNLALRQLAFNFVRSYRNSRPSKMSFILYGGKLWIIGSHVFLPLLHERYGASLTKDKTRKGQPHRRCSTHIRLKSAGAQNC